MWINLGTSAKAYPGSKTVFFLTCFVMTPRRYIHIACVALSCRREKILAFALEQTFAEVPLIDRSIGFFERDVIHIERICKKDQGPTGYLRTVYIVTFLNYIMPCRSEFV